MKIEKRAVLRAVAVCARAAGIAVIAMTAVGAGTAAARTAAAQTGGAAAPSMAASSGAPAAATQPMPMPTPNPALAQLKFFAGKWQCTGTGYMEGKGHPIAAMVHADWDLNGFFMSLRYEEKKTAANPMPITAVEHWGYSDQRKILFAGQIDSLGGHGTQGTGGWEGDTLVWMGETHLMGATLPSRDTFVRHGDDEVTHVGELQQNGAWVKQDEQSCHRTK